MIASRWLRLGIVLSVAWAAGAGILTAWLAYQDTETYLNDLYPICLQALGADQVDECASLVAKAREDFSKIPFNWTPVWLIALGPLPVFWIVGWIAIRLGRWIQRGQTI
jgi:hypothetical protein